MDDFRADVKKLLNEWNDTQVIPYNELTTVNDLVWELSHRGIIIDKQLWLKKLETDVNSYWLAMKTVKYIISKAMMMRRIYLQFAN